MPTRRFGPYTVETSNEDKRLFGGDGITKGDLIDYYLSIAETIPPHLADRPLTLQRFPDGIDADGFYQKKLPDHAPDWIDRVRVDTAEGAQEQIVCSNAATLCWLAQQACITPHAWTSRRDRLEHPDRMVIDLDPPGEDFAPVRRAAERGRELFDELDLPAYVMTTGSRGLHLVVPLDRSADYDAVRSFARAFSGELADRHPGGLTVEQRKDQRGDRVYLDTSNNAHGQTAVVPYALRARPGAPVATPIDWDELGDDSLDARHWTIQSIPRRLGQRADPWGGMARHACSLERAARRLEG